MANVPEHLHTAVYLKPDGSLRVTLSDPAEVYLMERDNYKAYLAGKDYDFYGDSFDFSPVKVQAPYEGEWHVVITQGDRGNDLQVALQITNGEQLQGSWDSGDSDFDDNMSPDPKAEEEPAPDIDRKKVLKDLRALLPKIDDEGLSFLLRQAKVLVHNNKIDKLNEEIDELNVERSKAGKKKSAQKGKKKGAGKSGIFIDIEDRPNTSSFILKTPDTRKILNRAELRAVAKICHANPDAPSGASALYRWLKKERSDILSDARIRDPHSPLLADLYHLVKGRYKAKS